MGEIIEFPSNGDTATGYLAVPATGQGPGVVVIQEWWGLVPHIRDVCDRFATQGFVALAPDLYRGESTIEPDEAGKLMMSMNLAQAGKDMGGAVDALVAHEAVSGAGVAVVGFCMGGGLALLLAAQRPDAVVACAPYYGIIPWPDAEPDWSTVGAVVEGHFAADDGFFSPDKVRALEGRMRAAGVTVDLAVHPGVDHAFFNDARPEVYDAVEAAAAWTSTLAFFHARLGA